MQFSDYLQLLLAIKNNGDLRQSSGLWYFSNSQHPINSKLLRFLLRNKSLLKDRKNKKINITGRGLDFLEKHKRLLKLDKQAQFPSLDSEITFRLKGKIERGYLLQIISSNVIYLRPKESSEHKYCLFHLQRANSGVPWKGQICRVGFFHNQPLWNEIIKYKYLFPENYFQPNNHPKNSFAYYQCLYNNAASIGKPLYVNPTAEEEVASRLFSYGTEVDNLEFVRYKVKSIQKEKCYTTEFKNKLLEAFRDFLVQEKELISLYEKQYVAKRIRATINSKFLDKETLYQIPSKDEILKFNSEKDMFLDYLDELYPIVIQPYEEIRTKQKEIQSNSSNSSSSAKR